MRGQRSHLSGTLGVQGLQSVLFTHTIVCPTGCQEGFQHSTDQLRPCAHIRLYRPLAAWQIPYAGRVDSITNFQHLTAGDDTLTVDDLVRQAERLRPDEVERIRTIALQEPLLRQRLIAPQGHVTGINVTLRIPAEHKEQAMPQATAVARTLAVELRRTLPDLDIYLTGEVVMGSAFAEATAHDLRTLLPIMLILLIVALGCLLGALTGMLVTVLVLCLAITTALGMAGWWGFTLSPSSAAAPTIIMTCALADCVHLLAVFFQRLRAGSDRRTAVVHCLQHNAWAMCLTGLTTTVGFLSMNFSDVPVFRDLGNISAFGVVSAFLLSVTLLPVLMMLLPIRRGRPRQNWSDRLWQQWPILVVRWRRPLFWSMTTVTIVLLACMARNDLNDDVVHYFKPTVDFRRATEFTADHLTGITSIDYSLRAGSYESIHHPDYLAQVEAFATWYRQQPEVLHVYTVTDIFKVLNRVLHDEDPTWYRLPETSAMAAQYLLLYEMSLPYGLDLNDRISVDKKATRLSVTLKNLSSRAYLAVEKRAQVWLAAHAPALGRTEGGGLTLMFAHLTLHSIQSMLLGTVLAEVIIALILIVAVRSCKIGLLSLIPNLTPAGMAFGLWGLCVGQVGMTVSVVASMTLGIVVDDTVHFLSHYVQGRREHRCDATQAVTYAIAAVGPASLVTGLILILGFSVLVFADFQVNAVMGLLTAIAIAFATVAEFLYLPPLLLMIEGNTHATRAVAAPASDLALSDPAG